jgi:hypothetical protein
LELSRRQQAAEVRTSEGDHPPATPKTSSLNLSQFVEAQKRAK